MGQKYFIHTHLCHCVFLQMTSNRSTHMNQRLKREFDDIVKNFNVVVSPTRPDGSHEITWMSRHSHPYVIILSSAYPFKPPMIYLNRSRIDMMVHSMWELRRYKEIYDVCGCECCVLPTRAGSWSPCIVLDKIMHALEDQDTKWYTVRLDFVRQCFPTLVSDIQNVIAEYL